MEESLSSEDEVSENSKTDVNTATTVAATGGKGKRNAVRMTLECFHVHENSREEQL